MDASGGEGVRDKKRFRKIIEGNKTLFREKDKIEWSYEHHLNSKSSLILTKYGIFIRYIHHRGRDQPFRKMCFVHFEGNKNPSRVRVEDISLRGMKE